ncbi:unnamed protein product [Didymodactylos carnosus]|uniref:Uncharacterized protein n=1 Tax=Didymodactylos carnosus TaxID=1234261 RepID=A0A8S2ZIN8_9BILA|nr:unnamed protein product [Didymodactylos carnosus]
MAEAAWAGIRCVLNELLDKKVIFTINLISDSPISQYRNKTMFFLMKKFAVEHKIEMKWIFLESGHGKGIADAIGGALKRKFDDAINFQPDESFSSASDLLHAVEHSADKIKLYLYEKSDVEEVKKSLPKLETIKGTASFHEVMATSDGKLYGKDLSSDTAKLLKTKF